MRRFGRYQILDSIARGGGGEVFRARDTQSGRVVALKVLRGEGRLKARRLEREAASLLRLEHPHVVRVLDVGEHEGALYLAMELLEESLEARLQRGGPLGPRAAAELTRKLALAVAHAHRCGLLHRDLKPSNVLFARDGAPKLADFGLALDVDGDRSRLTVSGAFLGTPGYWAPEQAQGRRADQGPHTDVYGLGATLFAALTGQPPFEPSSMHEAMAQSLIPAPRASSLNPAVDRGLDDVVARCLALEPGDRFADGDELARALGAYLAGGGGGGKPRRRAPLAILVAAAAAVVVGGYLALGEEAAAPPPPASPDSEARVDEAEALLEKGAFAEALERLDGPALQSERGALLRGEALFWTERFDEAERAFDDLRRRGVDPARVAVGLGAARIAQLEVAQGWSDLVAVPEAARSGALYDYAFALASFAQGEAQGGLEACRRALRRYPRLEALRALELNLLLHWGSVWDARDLCEAWVAEAPRSVRARAELIAILFGLGLESEGRAAVAAALAEFPGEWRIELSASHLEQGAGDFAGAERRLLSLIQALPERVEPRLRLANLYLERRDTAAALEAVEGALALVPHQPRAHLIRSEVFEAAGAYPQAVDAALAALENEFQLATTALAFGQRLLAAGQRDAAQRLHAGMVRVAPDRGYVLNDLGRLLLQAGATKEAEAALRRGVTWEPVEGLRGLIFVYAAEGREGSAADALEQLRALPPSPARDLALAHSLDRLGDPRAAEEILTRGLDAVLEPEGESLRVPMLVNLGRTEAAEAVATRCLHDYPTEPGAHVLFANALAENGLKLAGEGQARVGLEKLRRAEAELLLVLERGVGPESEAGIRRLLERIRRASARQE
ncbi:MAG: protein kinase [Planctomycetes bacterium]|nr:protein kinase [Planctomycetota bacterium]